MIDDFSICGINGAFGLTEKLRVQSVDELSTCLALILNLHSFDPGVTMMGRTYDSKSAYKQFSVDVFHCKHCRVGVRRPGGSVETFAVSALPFGATGSVASFLRIAASISCIAMVGLDIILVNLLNDFTVVCADHEIKNVDFYLTGLFKLLSLQKAFFWLGAAWVKSRAERPSVSGVSEQLHIQIGCKLRIKTYETN